LIFFTTSSLSHIYPDVRMDAVRALNLLLDVCPEAMALNWSAGGSSPVASTSASSGSSEQSHSMRVLECYLALLHVRSGIVTNGLRTDMSPAVGACCHVDLISMARTYRSDYALDTRSTKRSSCLL
jgi:pre-rRNA-processing protein IPI1